MRILVVDDEPIIRQWFTMTIEKMGQDYIIAGEAGNGIEALEFCSTNPVDLVVTDIKMPIMDGIELIKALKVSYPAVRTLVLSSYSEFQFAKEALKYGACDYLLKAEVTLQDLNQILDKVRYDIQMEMNFKSEGSQIKRLFNENLYALRSIYLKDLIQGNVRSIQEFEARKGLLCISLEEKRLTLVAFSIDQYKNLASISSITDKELLTFSIINISDEVLENEIGNGCCFQYEDNLFLAIFNIQGGSSKTARESILLLISRIADALKRFAGIGISAGVSITYSQLEMLSRQLQEAVEAMNQRRFYGERSIVFHQDINGLELKAENKDLNQLLREISAGLDTGDFESVLEVVDSIFSDIENRKHLLSGQVKKLCMEISYLIVRKMRQLEVDEKDIDQILGDLHVHIQEIASFHELKQWMNGKAVDSINLVRRKMERYSEPIQKAIEYINIYYPHEISLRQLSDHVHLNRSYFCELFKKETGENFNDMLTRTRIEKAKELLAFSDTKVSDLAERVGYPNISYFSKVFKKYTGMTPMEYKEKCEKKNN